MSKVAIDRSDVSTKAREEQRHQHAHQHASSESAGTLLAPSSHPMLNMASMIGNQAVIQMMRGAVSQQGRQATGSSGEQLPDTVKEKMEQSFNTDFSNVKIYKDSSAASSIGAQAYAQGEQIHFAPGQYSPESQEGQKLIGHELAHVVQQREGEVEQPQGKGTAVNFDQGLEQKADAAGDRAAKGLPVNQSNHGYASHSGPSLASSVHSLSGTESAAGAPIQASFFKSILGGIKKAGQGFIESGGLQTVGNALLAGGKAFVNSGGLQQLGGAAMGGATQFAQDSGLADKASPYLEQAQPYWEKAQPFAQKAMQQAPGLAQKVVDSGAVGMIGGKMSSFGSSMEEGGGFKGLLGKGLGLAGNLLGSFGKKKKG